MSGTAGRAVPAVLAVVVGLLIACQARVNGELAARTGNGLEAAVVSFGSGLAVLSVVVAAVPSLRAGLRRIPVQVRAGRLRWWHCLGGLAGGYFVAVQSATVPLIGVALFTVAIVGGQTASSLLVDRAGLGPSEPRAVTGLRVVAATLAVLAVAVAVSDRLTGVGGGTSLALLLAVTAGVGIAVQQAINGRVAVAAGEPVAAAWVNFVVGAAALGLALGIAAGAGAAPVAALPAGPWWLYLGGVIGVAFIATAAWVVRPLGVLLFALLSITGQLGGALVLDRIAPTAGSAVGWRLYLGVALTGVAVGLAGVRR